MDLKGRVPSKSRLGRAWARLGQDRGRDRHTGANGQSQARFDLETHRIPYPPGVRKERRMNDLQTGGVKVGLTGQAS